MGIDDPPAPSTTEGFWKNRHESSENQQVRIFRNVSFNSLEETVLIVFPSGDNRYWHSMSVRPLDRATLFVTNQLGNAVTNTWLVIEKGLKIASPS